jgi:peptidoglycan/LPS O-acetylase OafA/YrhL
MLPETLMNDYDYCDHPDQAKSSSNSLHVLGWLAITLGFVEIAVGVGIYGQRWFGSISAGASFYGTAYILPFVLGGMAVYLWGYHGYAPVDRLCAKVMSVAAFFTAMFQSKTGDNVHLEKIGLLGVSPGLSNVIHSVAAVVLFLTLILWIGFLFTGSKGVKTDGKKVRNMLYVISAGFMTVGTVCFILDCFGFLGEKFPLVWLEEVVILLPAGFAILVKSGMWFGDN